MPDFSKIAASLQEEPVQVKDKDQLGKPKNPNPKPEKIKLEKINGRELESLDNAKMTRKTISMRFIFDLALSEMKDEISRERKRKGEKKMTDNELQDLIYRKFFEIPEYAKYLETVQEDLK